MLAQAGIDRFEQLQQMGSVACYLKVKTHTPKATLNLLWALEALLQNEDWRVVARRDCESLLLLDDLSLLSR